MTTIKLLEELGTRLWTARETATFLGIPLATLYQLNYKGTGPTAYVIGKYRRYIPHEVLEWVKKRAKTGSS